MKKASMTWEVLFAVIFLVSVSCDVALAQSPSKVNKPCMTDIERFCKGMTPENGGIAKCLKEHESELSPKCRATEGDLKRKVMEMREDCRADVEKFCKDVKPGAGRIINCLKAHETELSPACKVDISKHSKP